MIKPYWEENADLLRRSSISKFNVKKTVTVCLTIYNKSVLLFKMHQLSITNLLVLVAGFLYPSSTSNTTNISFYSLHSKQSCLSSFPAFLSQFLLTQNVENFVRMGMLAKQAILFSFFFLPPIQLFFLSASPDDFQTGHTQLMYSTGPIPFL